MNRRVLYFGTNLFPLKFPVFWLEIKHQFQYEQNSEIKLEANVN